MTAERMKTIAQAIAPAVREYVQHTITPLVEQVKSIEAVKMVGAPGPAGADGKDGADAPPVDLDLVAQKAAALLPVPKDGSDGKPGRDGKDADVQSIVSAVERAFSDRLPTLIADAVTQAVAAIERPKDGLNGRDGVDGKDGHSVTLEQVSPLIATEVTKAVEALPRPKDGAPGRDGVGVAGALVNNEGHLVLTLSNGTLQPLGPVVGAKGDPGEDGRNGKDGFGFDDLAVDHDGERTLTVVFKQGDRVKSFPATFPVQIHRGVFDVTKTYDRGDCATWGGSTWQAVRQTSGLKPGDGPVEKTGWLLVTKAGRDGRSGKDGEAGKPGRDGKDGVAKW